MERQPDGDFRVDLNWWRGACVEGPWAAAATMLAGVLFGGALALRPLLDVQLDTPESTALAIASALGRILFVGGLIGVHLAYGHRYGLVGQIAVWALAVVTVITLASLLATFGVVEAGSPLSAAGDIGTPLSLLLVSIFGFLLWMAGANRWAAGLLITLFPFGIVFGMLQAVPALTPLIGVVVGLAFIALGADLWQKAHCRPPSSGSSAMNQLGLARKVVVLLEGDATSAEHLHHAFDPGHLPAGRRVLCASVTGGGVEVEPAASGLVPESAAELRLPGGAPSC